MAELIEVCEQAARIGGRILLDWFGRVTVREKGPADLVTEADLEAQRGIQRYLAECCPEHGFVGEEGPAATGSTFPAVGGELPVWVVDPLDGTSNYVHGVPHFATSVAAVRGNAVLAAAVYNPCSDECFTATPGGGANLNGVRIRASGVERLSDALVAGSFPPRVNRDSTEVSILLNVLEAAQSVRRTGSAALNMCYIAAGRYDAYWATETKAWDVAAGWLLVEEAGGVVTALDGGPFLLRRPAPAAAATPALSAQLLSKLAIDES